MKQETLEEAKIKHTKFCIENKIENPSFSFDKGAKWQAERIQKLRDELYNQLPNGKINGFDLITIIINHIKKIDDLI